MLKFKIVPRAEEGMTETSNTWHSYASKNGHFNRKPSRGGAKKQRYKRPLEDQNESQIKVQSFESPNENADIQRNISLMTGEAPELGNSFIEEKLDGSRVVNKLTTSTVGKHSTGNREETSEFMKYFSKCQISIFFILIISGIILLTMLIIFQKESKFD